MGLRVGIGTVVSCTDSGDDSVVGHQHAKQSKRRESGKRGGRQALEGRPKRVSQTSA